MLIGGRELVDSRGEIGEVGSVSAESLFPRTIDPAWKWWEMNKNIESRVRLLAGIIQLFCVGYHTMLT